MCSFLSLGGVEGFQFVGHIGSNDLRHGNNHAGTAAAGGTSRWSLDLKPENPKP